MIGTCLLIKKYIYNYVLRTVTDKTGICLFNDKLILFLFLFLFQAKKEFFRTLLFAVIFLKTKLTGDLSAEVVAADSVMGWVNSVVSTVVSAQVSTIVSGSQTVSVSVSTGSIGVSTISITVVGSGISLSLGFSLSLSITPLTAGGTGNGNVSGIDTGSTLNSVSVDAIVSSMMSISSKTVSGIATISGVSG
jgi:hypothetical protein